MNVFTRLRHTIITADRRLVVAGAVFATTALVGGIAFAASAQDAGDGTDPAAAAERAAPASSRSPDAPMDDTSSPDATTADRDPAGTRPVATDRPGARDTATASHRAATDGSDTDTDDAADGDTADESDPDAKGPEATNPSPTTAPDDPTTPSTTAPTSSTQPPKSPAPAPAPTTTAAPTPDELEPEPGPDAGKVVHLGGTTEQPTHPGPSMATVALGLVEDDAPPPPEFPPVPVPQFPTAGGGLVGNLFGCQADCIVHATLQPKPLSPNLTFDLETNVDMTASVWVSENQPVIEGGYPVVHGWPDHFVPGWGREWQTTIGLEYETSYWITLRVEDTQGNLKWALADYSTGPEPTPDQLAANGDGCYFQCIEFGKVEYTDSFDKVFLIIGTDVPGPEDIVFEVAVSTSEPTWAGGKPTLATQFPFIVDQDGGNDVRGHVSGLAPDTTYHVLVKAIDEDGYMAHAVGQFTTDPAPPTDVRVTWERFFVHYDGDAGAWGRGEIAWAWGMNDQPGLPNWATGFRTYAALNEDKIGDGTSIVLGEGNHHWVTVEAGADLPTVAVNAHENDTHGNTEYDNCIEYRQVTFGVQHWQENCMTRTNVALAEGLSVADIEKLPKCWQFDVPDVRGEDRCLVIESLPANDKHARFDALLSFHIPN